MSHAGRVRGAGDVESTRQFVVGVIRCDVSGPNAEHTVGAADSGVETVAVSMSPTTSSAPARASSVARGRCGSRTSARTGQPPARRWPAVAPPCRPVAPVTRMTPFGVAIQPPASKLPAIRSGAPYA
jgi:hypothetical protein